jgi:hypothetical protein
MKIKTILFVLLIGLLNCNESKAEVTETSVNQPVEIATYKARYLPGERVKLTIPVKL